MKTPGSRWRKSCAKSVEGFVRASKETAANPSETSSVYRKKLDDFFKGIGESPEWEVVNAVFGIAAAQPAFDLGPCRFFIMDQAELQRWGQRRRCARYGPPPGTIPRHFAFADSDQTGLDHQLLGNWVACLRVKAIDTNHAMAKAEYRLEEILNLLRHGAFYFGIPQKCVRAGVGHPQHWNNHSMCVRIYPPGGFQDSAGQGSDGLTIEVCSLFSQAWVPLHTVIVKEAAARTDLEVTVMTALE